MPKDKRIRIEIIMDDKGIDVKFSDWMKLSPRKLDRIRDVMGKAWRKERAKVIHEDRVNKAKQTKLAEQLRAEQEAV